MTEVKSLKRKRDEDDDGPPKKIRKIRSTLQKAKKIMKVDEGLEDIGKSFEMIKKYLNKALKYSQERMEQILNDNEELNLFFERMYESETICEAGYIFEQNIRDAIKNVDLEKTLFLKKLKKQQCKIKGCNTILYEGINIWQSYCGCENVCTNCVLEMVSKTRKPNCPYCKKEIIYYS